MHSIHQPQQTYIEWKCQIKGRYNDVKKMYISRFVKINSAQKKGSLASKAFNLLLTIVTKCHFPPLNSLDRVLVPRLSTKWTGGPFQSMNTSWPSCTPSPLLFSQWRSTRFPILSATVSACVLTTHLSKRWMKSSIPLNSSGSFKKRWRNLIGIGSLGKATLLLSLQVFLYLAVHWEVHT